MDLDFSGIILELQGCMECISRKNDHGEPPSMIIPDDHKMAQNVSDSPSPDTKFSRSRQEDATVVCLTCELIPNYHFPFVYGLL